MKNNWNQNEANNFIKIYKQKNISKDLALRVYTTQLLGKNNKLVLHGGGNTSLKTTAKNIFGEKIDVMHVKGSGWDMGSIDSPGLPAVELEPLLKTKKLSKVNKSSIKIALKNSIHFNDISIFTVGKTVEQ